MPPDGWEFWKRARRSRAQRVLLALMLLLGFGLAATWGWGLYLYSTGDNTEFLDGKVEARASADCARLDTALRALPALPPKATNQVKAARLDTQVGLMRELGTDMRGLGPSTLANDVPAEDWLRDWQALADERSHYAQQIRAGASDAALREPRTTDGYPISRRMKDAGPDSCTPAIDVLRQPLR